jgi:glycosyltransferase involved in cell wall biosynthesis
MKFSIILPVRNGGEYVKECVRSILAQSYTDFNLIVLDNNSSDGTSDWLESIKDNRIEIYRSEKPVPIETNWSRIKEMPKNEFMTMIGHDDLLDRNYLQVMDELITRHPMASLYQSHFRYIDFSGKETGKCKPMDEVQKPGKALHNFLCDKTDLMGTGFMMRSRDYDHAGGIPPYPNLLFADMELWIELSRKSYLAVDRRETFSYRKHPVATTSSSSDAKFLGAFKLLIDYLHVLVTSDPDLAPVIRSDSNSLLQQYCQGITHKILRTAKKKRQTPGVEEVIDQFREFGRKLGNESFEPLAFKKIRFGKFIDNSTFLHRLFLLFKGIYKKPLLKN